MEKNTTSRLTLKQKIGYGCGDAGGLFTVYGPFRYDGAPTSDSNAAFDATLRAADPLRGVRDFEAVAALAREAGLALVEDRAMPSNNRCITWRHVGAA